jgi:hypothetical protein
MAKNRALSLISKNFATEPDVWPLIENSLDGLGIQVYVYTTYIAGKVADEPVV